MGVLQEATLSIQSDLTALNQIQEWFKQFCLESEVEAPWLENQLYVLNLAIAEGFTNAVRHAHKALPADTAIDVGLCLWGDRIEIRIWDRGEPFDPTHLEEPEPGTLRTGGYGWFLLRRLADRVDYQRYQDKRNCLLIVKYSQSTPSEYKT